MIGFDYEPALKLYKNGEEVEIVLEGRIVKAKVIQSTIEDYIRRYLVRFEDGSESWFSASLFKAKLN